MGATLAVTLPAVTTTDEGVSGFSIDATHGTVNDTATINVQPQRESLSSGIRKGSLRVLFADGTLSIVSVVGVVPAPTAGNFYDYQFGSRAGEA